MSLESICKATREAAVLFAMDARGVFEVSGSERVRWLDGMISGDVARLEKAGFGAGCYATLLTNRGKIIADLHVGNLGEIFIVESLRDRIPIILETLERFIIADDVTLRDVSADSRAFALEGPAAAEILKRAVASGAAAGHDFEAPPAEGWAEVDLAGATVRVAAFGFTGESAYQVIAPLEAAHAIETALLEAGESSGLIRGDANALEVLRVEAGIPALGRELSDSRLPPEARLERAIATNKGCYVGQEIVARLRARGQVNHLLVGLRLDIADVADGAADAVGAGTSLSVAGRRIGELTTCVSSPRFGRIALGYVRREHADPGTTVDLDGGHAQVAALPFDDSHDDTGGASSKGSAS